MHQKMHRFALHASIRTTDRIHVGGGGDVEEFPEAVEDLGRVRLELERVRQVVWRRGYGGVCRPVGWKGQVIYTGEVRNRDCRGGERRVTHLVDATKQYQNEDKPLQKQLYIYISALLTVYRMPSIIPAVSVYNS